MHGIATLFYPGISASGAPATCDEAEPPSPKKSVKGKKAGPPPTAPAPYNVDALRPISMDLKKSFRDFYMYCFVFMKKP